MTLYDLWQRDHGGDFAGGVQLLLQHAPRSVTGAIAARLLDLSRRPGWKPEYESGKLEAALRKSPAPVAIKPATGLMQPVLAVIEPVAGSAPIGENLPGPQEMDDLKAKARILHKEHSHTHTLMVSATTDSDRARHAREIMTRILPALDRLYDRMRGEAEADQLPDATPTGGQLPTDREAARRRLQSVRTRIARLRNELIPKAPTVVRQAQLETELTEKLAEKQRLEDSLL